MSVDGVGLRVQGSGIRVQGLRFRVERVAMGCTGCGGQAPCVWPGFVFRALGFGFRFRVEVWNLGIKVLGLGFSV